MLTEEPTPKHQLKWFNSIRGEKHKPGEEVEDIWEQMKDVEKWIIKKNKMFALAAIDATIAGLQELRKKYQVE